VGSDSGAIPEVIGEAGLGVREGDAAALAQGLESAMFDEALRARLIPAGKRRAEEELSVDAMSRKLLEFYRRISG
jgi:glycosyltransferase involved in cell wall biosynthesis